MVITVTPNTALDRTLRVARLLPNRTLRATPATLSPTGKGIDVSLVLAEIGVPSVAMGFVAGETGRQLKAALRAKGIDSALTRVAGETRINTVVIGEQDGSHTTITAESLIVHEWHVAALVESFTQRITQATCVALGGSIPAGVNPSLYAQLITLARQHRVPTIIDATGEAMTLALAAQPDWIKPNREELEAFAGCEVHTLHDVWHAAQSLRARHGVQVLASLGAAGLLVVMDGGSFYAPALKVPVVNPAGAGDALVAGLAASMERGESVETGVRMGVAAAAATLMKPGTAECDCADIERLLPAVQVMPFQEPRTKNEEPRRSIINLDS
jgi:1-phosphofructokinase family hexose kinase